jgi:hypothetical protein
MKFIPKFEKLAHNHRNSLKSKLIMNRHNLALLLISLFSYHNKTASQFYENSSNSVFRDFCLNFVKTMRDWRLPARRHKLKLSDWFGFQPANQRALAIFFCQPWGNNIHNDATLPFREAYDLEYILLTCL